MLWAPVSVPFQMVRSWTLCVPLAPSTVVPCSRAVLSHGSVLSSVPLGHIDEQGIGPSPSMVLCDSG